MVMVFIENNLRKSASAEPSLRNIRRIMNGAQLIFAVARSVKTTIRKSTKAQTEKKIFGNLRKNIILLFPPRRVMDVRLYVTFTYANTNQTTALVREGVKL